jgi:hypothetical protein
MRANDVPVTPLVRTRWLRFVLLISTPVIGVVAPGRAAVGP